MHAVVLVFVIAVTARCGRSGPTSSSQSYAPILRVGVQELGPGDALNGLRQLTQILSTEGLGRIAEDGRAEPWLADSWSVSVDGLSLTIRLRPHVTFHDGSSADAQTIVRALTDVLPKYMGPAFRDIERISAAGQTEVIIAFKRRSPFLLEGLEAPIQKPGSPGVGTGPYMAVASSAPNELLANPHYYLDRPAIDRIVVNPYPNVRSAWADMLRERVDMLFEVGVDALDSLTSSKNVSVFTYVRHYQHAVIFNTRSAPLRSPDVRRALNKAVDRDELIREGLDNHALPSYGLIWPKHWAFKATLPTFSFDQRAAAIVLGTRVGGGNANTTLRFTCLVRPGLERVALVLKRQLEAVGVEMLLEEAPLETILEAMGKSNFDAVLIDFISGPSLFRPYQVWRSGGLANPGGLGTEQIDAALDRVRHAADDAEYREAVERLQETIVEDPPAIFLAWSERARAVNRRFVVPAEPGRDVLTTLRLWRPADAQELASRN